MKKNNISPEEFYEIDSSRLAESKEQIWKNVSVRIKKERKESWFDMRNFSFGFAAAIILFFFSAGVYSTYTNITNSGKSENHLILQSYSRAVDNFEKTLPVVFEKTRNETGNEIRVDELLNVKKEQLDTLSFAIKGLKAEIDNEVSSDLKYQRLISLYRMKLKVIDSILELEEN